ncbi:MAG: hypothetical protein GY853_13695 [PVC group bacterium]|nr:hypothetical protein [PVC group bacterium]
MAKLGIHKPLAIFEQHMQPSEGTSEAKHRIAVCADGKILRCLIVRFKPDAFDKKARLHNYGWKLWRKVKKGTRPEMIIANFENNTKLVKVK